MPLSPAGDLAPLSGSTIVFDLDGTLVDSAPDLVGTLNFLLAQEGIAPLPLDAARPMIGRGARALILQGFAAVAGGRLWALAIIAALNAMLGVAVYLRWLRILFGARKDPDQADTLHPVHRVLVVVGACALVVASIAPQSLLQIVGR